MHPMVLAKKEQIASACRRARVVRLDVFGSAARATDFEPGRSDVDFLVVFRTGAGEDPYLSLKEEFEDILDCPVDLLDRAALEASRNYLRRAHILAEIETVYLA